MRIACANEELDLLQRLISGDEIAFREIYNHYHETVSPFAFHLTKSKEHAREITQEVFITIWEKRTQINTELCFKSYLKKITLNQVLNFFKKANRDKKLLQEIVRNMQQLQASGSEEMLYERHMQKVVQNALVQLPSQKRIIFHLSRNEEFSYAQIAQKLNLSRSTVKNHMVEAIKILRRTVSNQLL